MDDWLRTYSREVASAPVLPMLERHGLAWRARNGDPAARDMMIRSHLRLVTPVVISCCDDASPVDLFETGNRALVRAVSTFDPSRDGEFADYARRRITEAIRTHLGQADADSADT